MTQIKEARPPAAGDGAGSSLPKKKGYLIRFFCFLGVLLVLSGLYGQFLLPYLAEKAVAGSFCRSLQAADARADIRVSPDWKLFFDQIDGLELELSFSAASLPLSSFQAEWPRSDTLLKNIRAGEAGLKENGPRRLTYVWDARAFRRYLSAKQDFLSDIMLEVKDDTIVITAQTALFGADKKIALTLVPRIDDSGKLVLEVVRMVGLDPDSGIGAALTEALTFDLQLLPVDWRIRAQEVKIDKDRIIITATGI